MYQAQSPKTSWADVIYDQPQDVAERIIGLINGGLDLALLLDVDGALVNPNDHKLTTKDQGTLQNLLTAFNNAAALFTDNDMRMVHPMAPYMPVISEGGARLKLTTDPHLDDVISVPPPFDVTELAEQARALAAQHNMNHSLRGEAITTNGPTSRLIIEPKEAGLGLNYGTDEGYKTVAIEIAEILKEKAERDNPDLKLTILTSGTDCIELRPADFEKYLQLESIMQRPLFAGRVPIIAGDSMTDGKAIEVAAKQFGGYGVAIGPSIIGMDDHLIGRLRTPADWRECLSIVSDKCVARLAPKPPRVPGPPKVLAVYPPTPQ